MNAKIVEWAEYVWQVGEDFLELFGDPLSDGYKLANMYTYAFVIPAVISVCCFIMVYNLFKLARIEHNRTASVCAWITLVAWFLAFAASLSIAIICGQNN